MWDKSRPDRIMSALHYDAFSMQQIIDADRYLAYEDAGRNICGEYADFCEFCSKWADNPCVTAYCISKRYKTVVPMIDSVGISEQAVVQAIIDVDKYLASEYLGCDLCGKYAPFCMVCDKEEKNPCAKSYERYKSVEGKPNAVVVQSGGLPATTGDAPLSVIPEAFAEVSAEEKNGDRQDREAKTSAKRAFRIGSIKRHA